MQPTVWHHVFKAVLQAVLVLQGTNSWFQFSSEDYSEDYSEGQYTVLFISLYEYLEPFDPTVYSSIAQEFYRLQFHWRTCSTRKIAGIGY